MLVFAMAVSVCRLGGEYLIYIEYFMEPFES